MKKYRVVRTFPGSLNRGDILRINGSSYEYVRQLLGNMVKSNWCSEAELKEYPEYFEEVIEKDYEIIEEKYIPGQRGIGVNLTKEELEISHNRMYNITKIKRLSDNVEFSIGDAVIHKNTGRAGQINAFHLMSNGIWFRTSGFDVPMSLVLAKVKTSLFRTEEGIDIYEGDSYWCVNTAPHLWSLFEQKAGPRTQLNKTVLAFSTKTDAEEYISKHKPQYTEQDMLDFGRFSRYSHLNPDEFKGKLNQETITKEYFNYWKLKNNK